MLAELKLLPILMTVFVCNLKYIFPSSFLLFFIFDVQIFVVRPLQSQMEIGEI